MAISKITNSGIDVPVDFNRTSTDGDIAIFQKDGTTVGSIGALSGNFYVAGSAKGLRVGSSSVVPATNTGSDSDNAIDLGYASSRFKDLYLSGGVYLGGTGSANHLDDYEEGTWTPVFADATTGGNVSSTAADYANYVKIGSFVHVNCRVTNISTSGLTSTNAAWVTGFPFVSNSESVGSVWRQNVTSATDLVGRLGQSVSAMRFDRLRSNDTDVTLSVLTFTNNVADFSFSLTYTTDA